MGKNSGGDIKQGKVTLPLLVSLNKGSRIESKQARKILVQKKFNKKNLDFLYSFVGRTKAIEETIRIANNYSLEAISAIEVLKDSQFKESLINLAKQNSTRVF